MNTFVSRRKISLALALSLSPSARAPAQPKRFPERPIQLLVPFGAGGIADLTARAVADGLAQRLKQPVIVDNRPSAGSIVASQAVANAKPDGHTLLLMSNGHAVSVGLFKKLPYDTQRSFALISTLSTFDLGLFVPASSPFTTLRDLLSHANKHPGRLNVGTIAVGSTQHLAAKLFETMADIQTLVVPFKATPAVLTALRGGEIDVAMEIVGPMLPQVQAGAVRALATTGQRRHAALPDVPTIMEAGVPRYHVSSWNALAAPAGTPPEVLATLGAAIRDVLGTPSVQLKLSPLGVRHASSTSVEADALLASEIKRWGDVIRAAKIEAE